MTSPSLPISLRATIEAARALKASQRAALLQGRTAEAARLGEIRRLAAEQMYDAVFG